MRTDELNKLLVDIVNGAPIPVDEPESTRALREELQREVDEIVAKGGIVDIPPEIEI